MVMKNVKKVLAVAIGVSLICGSINFTNSANAARVEVPIQDNSAQLGEVSKLTVTFDGDTKSKPLHGDLGTVGTTGTQGQRHTQAGTAGLGTAGLVCAEKCSFCHVGLRVTSDVNIKPPSAASQLAEQAADMTG